jgi:hypothetical protein
MQFQITHLPKSLENITGLQYRRIALTVPPLMAMKRSAMPAGAD